MMKFGDVVVSGRSVIVDGFDIKLPNDDLALRTGIAWAIARSTDPRREQLLAAWYQATPWPTDVHRRKK